MSFQLFVITFVIWIWIVTIKSVQITADISGSHTPSSGINESNSSSGNSRTKRFLIFQGAGVLKLVIGFSQPMDILDKYPYRQLAAVYAFHLQYNPPTRPVYWWTYFDNSTAWTHARTNARQGRARKLHKQNYNYNPHLNHYGTFVQRYYRQPAIAYDASRYFVYKALETVFNSKGLPGDRCLLRTICEISQRPLDERNAIHGIINAIFSPSVANIDRKYMRAKEIGVRGLSCEKIYWSCNDGIKWLEKIDHYI